MDKCSEIHSHMYSRLTHFKATGRMEEIQKIRKTLSC
jgi:hypothetical protein